MDNNWQGCSLGAPGWYLKVCAPEASWAAPRGRRTGRRSQGNRRLGKLSDPGWAVTQACVLSSVATCHLSEARINIRRRWQISHCPETGCKSGTRSFLSNHLKETSPHILSLELGALPLDLELCCCLAAKSLCDPMDCSPPGPSVHGILQARILEGALLDLGIKPGSSALADGVFTTEPPEMPTGLGEVLKKIWNKLLCFRHCCLGGN